MVRLGCPTCLRRVLWGLYLLASLACLAESIRLIPPSPYVADAATLEKAAEVARRAAAVANRVYGQRFAVSYGEEPADAAYTADLLPISSPQFSALTVTVKRPRDGAAGAAEVIYGAFDETMARSLAALLFSQWALLEGSAAVPSAEEPELLQELPADALTRTVLPAGGTTYLAPSSVAVRGNGNVIVGCISIAVEMDRWLRVVGQPGRSLLEGGNYTSSYGVAVTPADTVYLKPSSGRELYRTMEGIPRPQRVKVTIDTSGAFAALPDGSFVLADWQQKKAIRYEGQRASELPLFSGQWSYLSAMAAGPEGTLWVCDSNLRSVRIYSPRGELLDVVIPVVDAATAGTATSMAVYDDGSFILHSSSGHLSRYRRDGTPAWRIKELPGSGPLPMLVTVAVDSATGGIYLADYMGKRMLKLVDLSYRRERGISGGVEEEQLELARVQAARPDDPEPVLAKAARYEGAGAFEVARSLFEGILDIDPFNQEAGEGLERLELAILKGSASASRQKTVETLESLGPASARTLYDATMRLYEQILSLAPGDQEVRDAMAELDRRFREKSSGGEGRRLPITISSLELTNVFPALMQSYRESPVGYVTVKNTLTEEIRDLKASIAIARYTDYPSEGEAVASLKAGESARIGLPLLLNTQVLDLQEDLPVQAEVRVSYEAGGQDQEVRKTGSLTIYRRTALLWDDSGKLSSFVTPNESTVATFALRVAEGAGGVGSARIPARLLRAMRICDALGAYGINYVEDPDSPISSVLGRSQAIDTVRFPRMTMVVKSGDCDDSTALLGSLLESAGIATAVLTTPGHVFLAFDTGEPEENAWLFEGGAYGAIRHGGTTWLPVESTAVKKGFFASWATASELVKRHSAAGELEFMPVAEQRSRFPALPLPETTFSVVEPGGEEIEPLWRETTAAIDTVLYQGRIEELSGALAGQSGVRAVKTRNRIAALHARYGHDAEAEAALLACVAAEPSFVSSYVNLGSLYLASGRPGKAQAILERARAQRPDATLASLLLAESLFSQGDRAGALKVYGEVRASAPDLAARYAYLGGSEAGADGTARAAEAGATGPLIWDAGEE